MNQYIQEKKEEFGKAIDFFKKEISTLRTGRANPAVLEGVLVESYGVKTPLNGLASVNVPDGQSILVVPWDKNIIKQIEKALVDSGLGFGIVNDGDKIRLTVPKMTEESRRDLVKKLNDKHEAARISIRHTRDDIKQSIEKDFADKAIAEDDKFRFIKELDEEISEQNNNLKDIRDQKESDIMSI